MVGDWVVHGFGHTGKVTAIDKTVITVHDKGLDDGEGNCEVTFALNEIKPIPLTAEILKKNGFMLQSDRSELGTLDTYWFGSELGGFRIHRLNNGNYQFGLAKIRNVHELQHALRLCGIENEIILRRIYRDAKESNKKGEKCRGIITT